MRPEPPVVIVGAGLAGLACARELRAAGVDVLVLEADESVGGRVSTDRIDGFTIDHGFQVLNTAYPALRAAGVLDRLDLRPLPRGVRIRRGGSLADVPHPLSSPTAGVRAATSRAASAAGKLALARYTAGLLASRPASIKRRPDVEATAAWAGHVPAPVIQDVLVPFMSGVVLEAEITTSRVFTDLMMRMFALGTSAVPARGMQALPEALAADLQPGAIRCGSSVVEVDRESVLLGDGTVVEASAVVVATDAWAARRLVPELGDSPAPRGVTTYYFAADPWPHQDGVLTLDADRSGVTSSVVLTASAPEYSTDGRSLIAASVLHDPAVPRVSASEAGRIAAELHHAPDDRWELVATRAVPHALPAMTPPHPQRRPVRVVERGLWVAGDHRDTSSIQGALVSGRRTAASVARALAR